jgi:hypothetical protein
MRILVNHLTRMVPGFICVAGVDVESGRHVRPLTNRVMIPHAWSAARGGAFGIGNVVDLGPARYKGAPPEVEDHLFHEQHLRCVERLGPAAFWQSLEACCETRLQRIFGPELRLEGHTCVTDAGQGRASLGCIVPRAVHDLTVGPRGSARLSLEIGQAALDLPVTDLRFYEIDERNAVWVVDRDRVESVRYALQTGVPVILSVGLTRAFQRSSADRKRHWLQVNNIHLADDPLGDLELAPA